MNNRDVRVRTVDAHCEGDALRLVVEGFPVPRGSTMLDKREWATEHVDGLRRALMLEPRGHGGMWGAILTEPTTPESHAGLLFMDTSGWRPMCVHAVAAVTAIALRYGLLVPGGDGRTVVFDTPAGRMTARAHGQRFETVSVTGVPAFVLHAGVPLQLSTRLVHVDVAFGGEFYAIVDSEAVGLSIAHTHVAELALRTAEIVRQLGATAAAVHPIESRLSGISGVMFTGPASSSSADLRSVTVSSAGQSARSPHAAGVAAVMAVLAAMGLLAHDTSFTLEGPVGTIVTSCLAGRTRVGEIPSVIPETKETVWVTGEHSFVIEADDPFREGFAFL